LTAIGAAKVGGRKRRSFRGFLLLENSDHTGDAMNNLRQRVCVLFLGIYLAGSGGIAADPPQNPISGLLVRLQFTVDELGTRTFHEELYYRDGLVISRTVVDNVAKYARGPLSTGDLAKLRSILNENHVGVVVAPPGCLIPSPFPDFASLEEGSLTWFGKNGRQRYLTVNKGGDDYCPEAAMNLFLDILALPIDFRDAVTTVP
jgi:hypothetical protein